MSDGFQIGAMTLQRSPLLNLQYGVVVPLDQVPVQPLATYALLNNGDAERIARASSPSERIAFSRLPSEVFTLDEAPARGTKGEKFKWNFWGDGQLLRVSYPAPFIVSCYKITASGKSRRRRPVIFCHHAEVITENQAVDVCARSWGPTIYDSEFRELVKRHHDELGGNGDANDDILRVRYQGSIAQFDSGEAIVARFVRLMLPLIPDREMNFKEAAESLASAVSNHYAWARKLCSSANQRLADLGLLYELKATKRTSSFYWKSLPN